MLYILFLPSSFFVVSAAVMVLTCVNIGHASPRLCGITSSPCGLLSCSAFRSVASCHGLICVVFSSLSLEVGFFVAVAVVVVVAVAVVVVVVVPF